jgi:hypothetical protein
MSRATTPRPPRLDRPTTADRFFRIVEQEVGWWLCRRGQETFKRFWKLDDAIEHVTGIARENPPSKALVHHLGERVQSIATFE